MSFGIEVFSGNGRVRLDPSKRTVRLVKALTTYGQSSGSVSVPEFTESKGFIATTPSIKVGHYFGGSWDESNKTFTWDSANDGWATVMFILTE